MPFVWAASLTSFLLVTQVLVEDANDPLVAISIALVALSVVYRLGPRNATAILTAVTGLFVVLTSPSIVLSSVENHETPSVVADLAKEYSIVEATLKVLRVERHQTLVRAKIEELPEFQSSLILSPESSLLLSEAQELTGFFRLKANRWGDAKLALVQQGSISVAEGDAGLFQQARSTFVRDRKALSSDSGALVAGLTIGDDSALSEETINDMKTLSLTHLTAVSGANCAIVIGGVFLLLKRFGVRRPLAIAFSLLALASYVALVGLEPSVLRAGLMATVVLVALFSGRKIAPTLALAWAVILTLLFWPRMITDLGFWLSVSATAAIILIAPALYAQLSTKVPKFLALSLSVIVSAQLWCMPILLSLQGTLPTYSILANLLAEPLVAPITILGMLSLLAGLVNPWMGDILFWIASLFAWLIEQLTTMAELPANSIWWPSGLLGIGLMLMFVLAVSLRLLNKYAKAGLVVGVLATLALTGISGSAVARSSAWPPSNWHIASCDVGQGDASLVTSGGKVILIDVGREPEPIARCLTQLKVKRIDLLVLTHFDSDHVGGLQSVVGTYDIGQVLVSPFKDERDQVGQTLSLLKQHTASISTAEVGDYGRIGETLWQVIAPEVNAKEAEDSNDASIVLRVEHPSWLLLAFADAGERAQVRAVRYRNALLDRGSEKPLIVKVSHHGSADQYPELFEDLRPEVALFSAGVNNPYGHPTNRTLDLFKRSGSIIYRTDLHGSIALSLKNGQLISSLEGKVG
jgi:competence protein ComEC